LGLVAEPRLSALGGRGGQVLVRELSLVVDDEHVAELLRILNEDLTRGGLTRDPFVIGSKEPY